MIPKFVIQSYNNFNKYTVIKLFLILFIVSAIMAPTMISFSSKMEMNSTLLFMPIWLICYFAFLIKQNGTWCLIYFLISIPVMYFSAMMEPNITFLSLNFWGQVLQGVAIITFIGVAFGSIYARNGVLIFSMLMSVVLGLISLFL